MLRLIRVYAVCKKRLIRTAALSVKQVPSSSIDVCCRAPHFFRQLYSDYIYESRFLHYNISQRDFHETVLDTIRLHKECQQKLPIRTCAYNGSIEPFRVRLRIGMYYIFIRDWLAVFPKEQILVIKTEDMKPPYIKTVYQQICSLLGIRPFTKDEELRIVFKQIKINARNPAEKRLGDMWNKTRLVLTDFYRPYNEKLAKLLQNDKFLWKD